MLLDERWHLDGSWALGECEGNAARAHQKDAGLYGSAGISTTRSVSQVIKFATYGGLLDGYVYLLKENLLKERGVVLKEFKNPENRHEK